MHAGSAHCALCHRGLAYIALRRHERRQVLSRAASLPLERWDFAGGGLKQRIMIQCQWITMICAVEETGALPPSPI